MWLYRHAIAQYVLFFLSCKRNAFALRLIKMSSYHPPHSEVMLAI